MPDYKIKSKNKHEKIKKTKTDKHACGKRGEQNLACIMFVVKPTSNPAHKLTIHVLL